MNRPRGHRQGFATCFSAPPNEPCEGDRHTLMTIHTHTLHILLQHWLCIVKRLGSGRFKSLHVASTSRVEYCTAAKPVWQQGRYNYSESIPPKKPMHGCKGFGHITSDEPFVHSPHYCITRSLLGITQSEVQIPENLVEDLGGAVNEALI